MKDKKITAFNLSVGLLDELNKLSRIKLPNKSLLVEQLLENWLKKQNNKSKDEE